MFSCAEVFRMCWRITAAALHELPPLILDHVCVWIQRPETGPLWKFRETLDVLSTNCWLSKCTPQLSTKFRESCHGIRRRPVWGKGSSYWKCVNSTVVGCLDSVMQNIQHWDRWCQLLGGIWLSTSRLKNYSQAVVQRRRRRWGRVWSLDQCRCLYMRPLEAVARHTTTWHN